jgi:exosortase
MLKNPSLQQLALFKSAAIIFAVIAIYLQDLSLVFANALHYEGYSYILLIPALIIYLLYRKRRMLAAAVTTYDSIYQSIRHLPTIAGFLLCLTAFSLYIFGSQTFSPLQYHMISLPLFTAGLILILFNSITLRHAILPIIFLVFLTPPPMGILNIAGSLLSVGSTEIANSLANLLGVNSWISVVSGTPVINVVRPDNQSLSFAVDIACSGIYSLVGFVIFASFLSYIVRDKIWKKATMVSIGFPVIYLLNAIRITAIILIGYHWGGDLAFEVFHLLGGWVLVFLGTLLLLIIAEKLLKTRIFTKTANMKNQNDCSNIAKKYFELKMKSPEGLWKRIKVYSAAKIMFVLLVTLLIVFIQSPILALVRSPAPIVVQTSNSQQGNLQLFPEIEGYRLAFLYRDTDFEQLSGQDFSLAFAYYPENPSGFEVDVLLEVAETWIALHPWEDCLVEWPLLQGREPVTQLDLRDVRLQEDPPIIARYFAFNQQNQIQLVLYYFTTAIFEINNATQQRYVKLSFVTFFNDPNDLQLMENRLLPFAEETVALWEPLRNWNSITMIISNASLPLATSAIVILIGLFPFSWIRLRRHLKTNTSIYHKLHVNYQQIIDAVEKTGKKNLSTLDNIALTYQNMTNQPVNEDELLKTMVELERKGLLRNKIISKQDEPVYIWEVRF